MKLLVIANIMKDFKDSLTYSLANNVIENYKKRGYDIEIIDLYGDNNDIPEIDRTFVVEVLGKFNNMDDVLPEHKHLLSKKQHICKKVSDADIILFATGYWNSFYPIRLQNFLELLHCRGVTVDWEEGVDGTYHGLLKNKFLILQTQNWPNKNDGKNQEHNFGIMYLKRKMQFLGSKLIKTIILKGVATKKNKDAWYQQINDAIKEQNNE